MKWGTGEQAALARMDVVSRQELLTIGLTEEMALDWAAFYENEANRNPANGSARGRAALMRRAAELLGGEQ